MTIHDEIDSYLVADLHNELSEQERHALHTHLVECAACRQFHQENKIMNKILEENLATEKADPAFEQRMLSGFRNRVPQRGGGLVKLIVDLMRLRTAQITAVAALLLALVQVGRMITEPKTRYLGNEELFVSAQDASSGSREEDSKKDEGASFRDERARENSVAQAPLTKRADLAGVAAGKTASLGHFSSTSGDQLKSMAAPPPPASEPEFKEKTAAAETKGTIATGSNIPEQQATPNSLADRASINTNRKLIRNANVDLEIASFEEVVQKITAFASEERGYIATTSSEKQANGKLRGQVVVKVLPENLDRFLQKIRGLGELKNQTLGTEDVTKAYFDTDSRLKNARVMEQRLIDMLKTKTGKVADLLAVEKELGRVREEIEKMQGDLKYWDAQVQFATVTIALAEKDMEEPAAFLLKERAQLSLYAPDVEKIYNDIKALAAPKVQITNAQLDRDNSGRISARVSVLIAPEESDGVIGKVKAMARVENFQVQTERVAQGGNGMSENAKTKRDKVELNVSLSREEQEQAFQQTNLRIRTSAVDEKAKELRNLTEKQNGRIRSSTFSRDPNGREFANVSLRVPMKNYPALMQSLGALGKVEDVSVARQDRTGAQIDEANAPADVSIQVYSQGNIVSNDTGLLATLRRTIAQGAGALMWSLRMIGVALAFLAPWVVAFVGVIWIARRIRARRSRKL
jgi:hypothetical protein